jgi:hypothetical protein
MLDTLPISRMTAAPITGYQRVLCSLKHTLASIDPCWVLMPIYSPRLSACDSKLGVLSLFSVIVITVFSLFISSRLA